METGQTPPENVWVGTSVENQQCADLRIPQLLAIPARVRFLSVEPMLERIDLKMCPWSPRVDWVICGGESGPKARRFQADWADDLRAQCEEQSLPFFMKQMGQMLDPRTFRDFGTFPPGLQKREFPL
jgi:protein gp37